MKHTPEPWKQSGHDVVAGKYRFVQRWEGIESSDDLDSNARRIVACVNACRSVSDEDLADDCVEKMKADRDALLIQRDSLLSALRALYGWQRAEVEHFGATTPDDFIVEMVEKAIKNGEGK